MLRPMIVIFATLMAVPGHSVGSCFEGKEPRCQGNASSFATGPEMVLEHEKFDFGKMETNGTGRHEFVLANRGNQPLILN